MCVAKKMNPRVHPAEGARASSLVDRKSLLHSLLPKGLLQHDAGCLMSASKSLPWWHVLRLVILGVLLFPIRLILMVFNVAGVLLVANIITCCGRKMPRSDKPLVGCRKATVSCCIRPAIRFQAFLLGVWWVASKGKIASRHAAPIIVANHTSVLDPLLMVSILLTKLFGAMAHRGMLSLGGSPSRYLHQQSRKPTSSSHRPLVCAAGMHFGRPRGREKPLGGESANHQKGHAPGVSTGKQQAP